MINDIIKEVQYIANMNEIYMDVPKLTQDYLKNFDCKYLSKTQIEDYISCKLNNDLETFIKYKHFHKLDYCNET